MPGRNSGLPKPRPAALGGQVLPEAVRHRFGPGCPCCGAGMTFAKPEKNRPMPRHKATVGHDVSVARGGDHGVWYWQCNRCNNDQGVLDLVTWARKLVYADDPRAGRVVEVSKFVRGWVAAWLEEVA
jgi:hypothetical protein